MPLDKLVLIVVCVIAAAGATIWLGTLALTAMQVPGFGWALFIPAALVGYVAWRIITDRLLNAEDDHYDRIEK